MEVVENTSTRHCLCRDGLPRWVVLPSEEAQAQHITCVLLAVLRMFHRDKPVVVAGGQVASVVPGEKGAKGDGWVVTDHVRS